MSFHHIHKSWRNILYSRISVCIHAYIKHQTDEPRASCYAGLPSNSVMAWLQWALCSLTEYKSRYIMVWNVYRDVQHPHHIPCALSPYPCFYHSYSSVPDSHSSETLFTAFFPSNYSFPLWPELKRPFLREYNTFYRGTAHRNHHHHYAHTYEILIWWALVKRNGIVMAERDRVKRK